MHIEVEIEEYEQDKECQEEFTNRGTGTDHGEVWQNLKYKRILCNEPAHKVATYEELNGSPLDKMLNKTVELNPVQYSPIILVNVEIQLV